MTEESPCATSMLPRHPADRQTDITCECLGQRQAKQKLSVTLPLPKKRAHIASLFWACFLARMVGQLRGLWFRSMPQGFARLGVARACSLQTSVLQRPGHRLWRCEDVACRLRALAVHDVTLRCNIAADDVAMRCRIVHGAEQKLEACTTHSGDMNTSTANPQTSKKI